MGLLRSCFSPGPQYDAAETALRTAAARGDVDGVKAALKRGAHVDCRSDPDDPDTPLFAAVLLPETETAAVLLKAGASVHARNSHGAWPARRGRGRRRGLAAWDRRGVAQAQQPRTCLALSAAHVLRPGAAISAAKRSLGTAPAPCGAGARSLGRGALSSGLT